MRNNEIPRKSAEEYTKILENVPANIRKPIARMVIYDLFSRKTIAEQSHAEAALWRKYSVFDHATYDDDALIQGLVDIGCTLEKATKRVRGYKVETPKDAARWSGKKKGKRYKSYYGVDVVPYEVSPEIGFDPDKYGFTESCAF
jgi:hypothetical protein